MRGGGHHHYGLDMDLALTGQIAVVTGASRGIGLAVVRALVDEGAHVVAGARTTTPELAELASTGAVDVVEVDLSTPDGPDQLVESAGPKVDVLVNNVGSAHPRPAGFLEITDDMWRATLELDLMASVRAIRAVLPGMLARGAGAIVNIGSVNARLPDPLVLDYSAAKGAAGNMAKSLSKELGPHGIRVNTVDPGPVATDLWLGAGGVAEVVGGANGVEPDDVAAGAAAGMVTGRFSRPEEVADLVVVLASPRFGNVTGASFTIDGGLVTTL